MVEEMDPQYQHAANIRQTWLHSSYIEHMLCTLSQAKIEHTNLII
jgi:hypothetical protein